MDQQIMEKYIQAGKIASEVREASRPLVKIGARIIDIAEHIEKMIREKGGEPAFPVNISLNDIAAHYTPMKSDPAAIKDGDIVKIDIGVHVDGYVGDTACTICFNDELSELMKASEAALDEAIKLCKPGTHLHLLSSAIENTIKSFGFRPISNLTGHGLGQYDLHAEPQIPNISFHGDYELHEGQVIAIEPFATNGAGMIKESEQVLIFRLLEPKPVRNMDARKIMKFAEPLNGLPFSERWVQDLGMSQFNARMALRELREREVIHDYPVLKEVAHGMISQAEHTVIVKDEPLVTTR